LDYRFAYQYHLYFLTFRDILTWCIENGIKRYETGALSYEPKKRLGLEFVPMFVYAKHRNKLLNPFFKLLCSFLRPERFDPILQDLFCEKNDEKKPA
jgi:predicted N-acyltransferase